MSILVRADGTWGDDTTRVVRDAATQTFVAGDVVPLAAYLALAPARRAGLGVWLAPDSEPVQLAAHVGALALIAVDFPAFKDGRGFSAATLLRSRYGFRGDLRAIGDVVTDVLFYMRRVGFSSFALRADQDTAAAVAALGSFTDSYQASVDQPLPYFRRRAAPAGVAP
jgi:uncharacterized protein (DUF934 family)